MVELGLDLRPALNGHRRAVIAKARRVLSAIQRDGWVEVACEGSHHQLKKGRTKRTFSYHDGRELGTVQLKKVAKTFRMSLARLRGLL